MGGVIKSIGRVVHDVGHGVGHLFKETGKAWSKITPWDDKSTLGKALNIASIAALGFFGGSALGLWGSEASSATAAGAAAESGSGSLFSAAGIPTTASGAVDFAAPWGTTAAETAATGVASTGASLLPAATGASTTAGTTLASGFSYLPAATQETGGILGALKGAGSAVLGAAKAHPIAAGMIASGALQGAGAMMQAKSQEDIARAKLEEEQRQFNALHNMGLNTTAPPVESPVQRLRRQLAEQQPTQQTLTPQELEMLLSATPQKTLETRAGRFSSGLTDLNQLLSNYYNSGNIGLFRI